MEHLSYRPPVVGDQVGEYRLVAELGRGGHALVFKAERAGRFHAIKFYSVGMRPYWRREVDILRCLHGVEHVVRLEDWGEWPQPRAGWLYLVLELVEGWTLEGYALVRNPSARAAGRLFLLLGRTLVEARRRGVLHRDLKRENILVRGADGGPVLVDFGVGDLEGVSTLPRDGLPPGTAEYVSPEAWRYVGALKSGGARYEPGVGDEQWALGVNFYWLLTGRLPFGTRARMGVMLKAVVGQRPHVPHERNPRIPPALGEVCMRLLEKEPAARYPSLEALCAALEAALASMEGEARWDEPLEDPDAPDNRTTDALAELAYDSWARLQQELNAALPRRGRGRESSAVVLAAPPAPVPPQPEPPQPELPPALQASPVSPPAGPVPESPPEAERGRWRSTRAGLSVVLAALLGALVFPAAREPVSAPPDEVKGRVASPLARWLPDNLRPPACLVQEVATTWPPSEAGRGAARFLASTPAPAQALPLRPPPSPAQLPAEPTLPPPQKARDCVSLLKQVCTAGVCSLWLTGCTGVPVRPPRPPPADCPPGAQAVMDALDTGRYCDLYLTTFERGWERDLTVTVPLGRITYKVPPKELGNNIGCGNLPPGTRVSGTFFLGTVKGKTMAIARLTQAQTPEGKTYPVCLRGGTSFNSGGEEVIRPGDKPGTVVIREWTTAHKVERFE